MRAHGVSASQCVLSVLPQLNATPGAKSLRRSQACGWGQPGDRCFIEEGHRGLLEPGPGSFPKPLRYLVRLSASLPVSPSPTQAPGIMLS